MLTDDHNLVLLQSSEAIDGVNKKFYEKFQYPQTPVAFFAPADPQFETIMLNQSIGSWDHSKIPDKPRIWVAGCGTNQAVYTALRFPNAKIIASDLSETSLKTSATTARQLEITNLEFRQGSINDTTFNEEFDYVICTGVIHHNADPMIPLSRLAGALKSTGSLELMVYNRYHRIANVAFQRALRILAANPDLDTELRLAKKISQGIKSDNLISRLLRDLTGRSTAEFADAVMQPIEHTFTVESLQSLADDCGLELVAPCINQFDKAQGTFSWNMEFEDAEVDDLYMSLPDVDRWKISNHLMLKKSPMLWFYLRRGRLEQQDISEQALCEQFLDRSFRPSHTKKRHYFKANTGRYAQNAQSLDYPGSHPDPLCNKIIEQTASQPGATMRAIFRSLQIKDKFSTVNKLRSCLTTNAFPFLISAQ